MSEAKPAVPASRRRRLVRTCLALIVVAFGVWVWRDSQRGWTAARLERLIRSEVRPGCDRATVEAFLDRHGIERVWTVNPSLLDDSLGFPELSGLRASNLSGYCGGVIYGPEARVGFLAMGEIEARFFFDKRGHLLVYTVRAYVLWP